MPLDSSGSEGKPETLNLKPNWRTHALFIAALLALNLLVKWTLWVQTPQTFPDSLGYIAPAMRLLDGLGYGTQENGFRTPTYPLFIAAMVAPFEHSDLSGCREARVPACLGEAQQSPGAQVNLRAVAIAQIILGMAIILLTYWFAWKIAGNAWIAALCALTYPIDLSTAYWEISVLTDTLTTLLLMLAVALTLAAAQSTRHRAWWHVALGLVLGALALCHSVYTVYAVVPAAFLWWHDRRRKTEDGKRPSSVLRPLSSFAVLAIPLALVLAWSARNYRADGMFTPSTIAGYNMTQMVGGFMEQAPAEYRDLADIYLEYRSDRIAARGSHSGTIFFAYRDMLDARQTTWAGLSQILGTMSVRMIAQNPGGYAQTAWSAFIQFWKFGLGRQNPVLPISFDWVKWFLDSRVHQALAILFFLTPIALTMVQLKRRGETPTAIWIWFAIVTVLYAAVFSSAFNFGDNERYRTHVARLQYSAIILTAYLSLRVFFPKQSPN